MEGGLVNGWSEYVLPGEDCLWMAAKVESRQAKQRQVCNHVSRQMRANVGSGQVALFWLASAMTSALSPKDFLFVGVPA